MTFHGGKWDGLEVRFGRCKWSAAPPAILIDDSCHVVDRYRDPMPVLIPADDIHEAATDAAETRSAAYVRGNMPAGEPLRYDAWPLPVDQNPPPATK